jgi:NAD(P)-dependent dehydrogenase (short-subunit alcohol dehydrogenase family)
MSVYPSVVERASIVTGGSRGLGRAMVLGLAQAGARVAIVARGPSVQLDETLSRLRALNTRPEVVTAFGDLRDPASCEGVVAKILSAFGKIELLVNNAGVPNVGAGAPFWRVDAEEWRRISHTNTDAAFMMTRSVAPLMMAHGFGKIVNISTSTGIMVRKHMSPYGPSKAFLEACTRIWAQDLSGTGVTVNALLPGGVVDTAADVTGVAARGKSFLPASIMVPPLLWLASDDSNAHNGDRFVANLWDDSLPLNARIDKAKQSSKEDVRIM